LRAAGRLVVAGHGLVYQPVIDRPDFCPVLGICCLSGRIGRRRQWGLPRV
jgi:hypothetical protein